MKNYRVKTRIIATLGPSTATEKTLREMMKAGLNVCRINFSHGSLPERIGYIKTIKTLNKKYRRRIKLLADLEGARIRIGHLKSPVSIKKNGTVYLTNHSTAEKDAVFFEYEGSLTDVKPADFIYIDDGNITLKITEFQKTRIKTKVMSGELIKSRKGINIPGANLDFPSLTEKDKRDIDFIKEAGFNYIAQSFVRNVNDIESLKAYLGKGNKMKIVAKIENQEGINNIDGIIDSSDMIMIARGDMGISIPVYKVPFVQKELIEKCREAGKKSITATQMLESMTENILPTRAEVSDIANAVIDGTDYAMLSAETSVGKYPAECVSMMNQILKYSEIYLKKT